MKPFEFIDIAELLQKRWWAFPVPASALGQYGDDLVDLDARLVAAAVDTLAADGGDRMPTSGQIRRRVAELELDAPDWDTVRTSLVRWRADRPARSDVAASWVCPDGLCDGSARVPVPERKDRALRACSCRPAYVAALRGLDLLLPLVAEFMTGGHVATAELDRMLDQGDSTVEAQVRSRWREFVSRAVSSRVYAGLPSPVGVARLEAAREETATRDDRQGALRRLDAAGLLGAGRQAA